jgi:hypothetical protein
MRLLNFRRINIHPLTMRIASPLLGKAAFVELGLNYYVRYNTLSQPIGTQKKTPWVSWVSCKYTRRKFRPFPYPRPLPNEERPQPYTIRMPYMTLHFCSEGCLYPGPNFSMPSAVWMAMRASLHSFGKFSSSHLPYFSSRLSGSMTVSWMVFCIWFRMFLHGWNIRS